MCIRDRVYADMLGERIASGKTRVYLVNTGWVEGSYGVGPVSYTHLDVYKRQGVY